MRELRRASLRLIITLSIVVGCWAATLSAALVPVSPPAARAALV